MFTGLKIPKLVRWIFWTGIIFLVVMSLLRIIFYFSFNHPAHGGTALPAAFFLGFRFDLKMVCILLEVILVMGFLPATNPFRSPKSKRPVFILLALVSVLFVLFYIVDFAHYSYLSQRLSASALNYLDDAAISPRCV